MRCVGCVRACVVPIPEVGFDDVYRDNFSSVALVAGSAAGSWAAGEEVAQEAFAKAYERWGEVAGLDKPGAWIRRVAINLALNRRRSNEREGRAIDRLDRTVATGELDQNWHVWKSVQELPPTQRVVVVLHYHDGLPTAEIAELLDSSVSAVTTNLHKARTRLKTILGGAQ